jgi:hypothetical protein
MPHRLLHGEQGHNLQQVVLYDVPDDAILVKVAATTLRAKVLAEYYLSRCTKGKTGATASRLSLVAALCLAWVHMPCACAVHS